jgi:hypothetical protein
MAEKQLYANVEVDGVWFGPDYPDNKVTAEVTKSITNPSVWEKPADAGEPEAEKLIGESKDAPAAKTAQAPKSEG